MNITGYIWRDDVVDKLAWKHGVRAREVTELFENRPRIERIERGHRPGEDLYMALGQSDAGRYLTVFFVYKQDGRTLIVTAREITQKERRRYGKR